MNVDSFKEQTEAIIAECKKDFEGLKTFMRPDQIEAAQTSIESIEFFMEQNCWSHCIDETRILDRILKEGWEWKKNNP